LEPDSVTYEGMIVLELELISGAEFACYSKHRFSHIESNQVQIEVYLCNSWFSTLDWTQNLRLLP